MEDSTRRKRKRTRSTEDNQKKRKKENHVKRKDNTAKLKTGEPRQTLDYEIQEKQALQSVHIPIPLLSQPPNSIADAQPDIWTRDLYDLKLPSSPEASFTTVVDSKPSCTLPPNSDAWWSDTYPVMPETIDRDDVMFLQELYGYETE